MAKFKIGDKVKTKPAVIQVSRLNGTVKYVACGLATSSGGKKCDKKTCTHPNQDYVWVEWPEAPGKIMSYHHSDLDYDASQPPAPAPVLPDAKETSTGDAAKDAYLKEAKDAINKVVAKKQTQNDFFREYNGFTTIRYDRYGRPYSHEDTPQLSLTPLTIEQIDWDVYTGKKKGSLKKVIV
jgi:hypothetical protein